MKSFPDETTVAVIETVSEALGTPIEELPPLYESIDLEALESIVPSTTDHSSSDVTVAFSYAGLHVLIRSGNTVYVQPNGSGYEELLDGAYR